MSSPPESGPLLDATSPVPSDIPAADEPVKVPLAIEDWATVAIMGLLACITFANVLVRYFTDSSFAWTEEFSVFLMILLAMVAGSAAVARDRHIRIEYFSESGSMARRWWRTMAISPPSNPALRNCIASVMASSFPARR